MISFNFWYSSLSFFCLANIFLAFSLATLFNSIGSMPNLFFKADSIFGVASLNLILKNLKDKFKKIKKIETWVRKK